MPRQVPRPYECVRRAWHSDRHQPVRGSIVQQIFRLVDQVHSYTTKKNKEWHEKLPVVVLKAEEIIYSKANSEAEYMDLDTLWNRVKDAIDTIIRRDESTETGELLPPCVEAALNLGCTVVRASRSQRHDNLRTYLSPRAQEPPSLHSRTTGSSCSLLLPHQSSDMLNARNSTTCLFAGTASNTNKHANQDSTDSCLLENIPPGHNQCLTMGTNRQLNLGSVYPLYYGTEYQRSESQRSMDTPARACSDTIFVGTPVVNSAPQTAYSGLFWRLYSNVGAQNAATRNIESTAYISEMLHEKQCDLSLRLSLLANPFVHGERNSTQLGENLNQISPQIDKQVFLYPENAAHNSFRFGSTAWNLEIENQNLGPSSRKRKAPLG